MIPNTASTKRPCLLKRHCCEICYWTLRAKKGINLNDFNGNSSFVGVQMCLAFLSYCQGINALWVNLTDPVIHSHVSLLNPPFDCKKSRLLGRNRPHRDNLQYPNSWLSTTRFQWINFYVANRVEETTLYSTLHIWNNIEEGRSFHTGKGVEIWTRTKGILFDDDVINTI